MKSLLRIFLATSILLLGAFSIGAQEGKTDNPDAPITLTAGQLADLQGKIAAGQSAGDTAWILTSAALVLLMTIPGLALFYGGMVRRKNVLSTMYYSMGAAVVVSVLWVIVQYSLAFGGYGSTTNPINYLIGTFDRVLMGGMSGSHALAGTIPESVFAMFQLMFAIITVALISGSVVERMSLKAWLIFTVFWSLIVYAPLAHWVWGGGWLATEVGKWFGMPSAFPLDFAGGLVVHISSGVSALVLALVLGPRVRFGKDPIIPNNAAFTFIGAGLLWVGWFGFNAGSAVSANALAGNAFLVTNTAAAAAALVWIIIELIHHGKPSLIGVSTGVIAGLVAITPAAGFVDLGSSLLIGAVVAVICYVFVAIIKKKLGYDDSLDAFGIHAVGGMTGAILTGILANPAINSLGTGAVYGNPAQIMIQIFSILVAVALAIVGTLVAVGLTSLITKLRVEPQEEVNGLDITQHGEKLL